MLSGFTAYFDDAGGSDHGFTAVAGWISSVHKWESFGDEWANMLAEFKVPWFDTKTLVHFNGVYDVWRDDPRKKDDFMAEACRIIATHTMYGVASIVPHAVFAKVNETYRAKEYLGNEYALAGITCAQKTRKWIRALDSPKPYEIVLDDGTAKRGKLVDLMRAEGFAEPIFGSPKPKENRAGVLQLQAADFLAYEVRKLMVDDPLETRSIEQHRISVRKLIWVDSDWGSYTAEDLEATCENHPRVGKRIR